MNEEVFDLSDAIDIIYGDACAYEIPMGYKEHIIAKLLLVGDVFLMTLSKKNNNWGVSYMSPPYETIG